MDNKSWIHIASEAIERLAPYGPVILMGLESVRRHLGRQVERREFITAKSVYALFKTSFERDPSQNGRQLLQQFVKEPDPHRAAMIQLIAEKASCEPADFGRKLVALTNRWREDKRPLPPLE